ncbi:MAG: relaxase/mobilization nuclease domain-containing protein [Terriglobia bacterium]|jgi:hypothetical protein
MIPKGNQRGGGRQLATHLLNQFDNKNVEVLDLRGSVAQDLHGAFHEWYAQSRATKCRKYLYSLSVNPDLAKYDLTREQYLDFIARTERSLKLVGQPRAVVFHTKNGRQHCHAIWSRIDPGAGKAVHMAHDRFKLQAVAREFARDHGLPLPPGMQKNGHNNQKDKQSNLQEKQQQERSGISREERIKAITAVWQEHNKDPHAFVKALEEKGYHLANGDSGRYVVVDHAGEVHSLYRQIEGMRSNEVKAFLGADYPLGKLRDVETARAAALQGKKEQAAGKEEPQARREELGRRHEERRSRLDLKRAEMEKRIQTERRALLDLHRAEKDGVLAARAAKQPRGMIAFLSRITGIQAYITARHGRQDAARERAHKADREALDRRHGRDRQEMERRYASLAAVETRERQSLEIALKRQKFQMAREIIAGGRVLPESQLKPEFDRAAQGLDIRKGEGDSRAARKGQAVRDFAAALVGKQPVTKGDLQAAFERAKAAKQPSAGGQEQSPAPDPYKLEQARETKADLERRQRGHDKDRDPGDRGR